MEMQNLNEKGSVIKNQTLLYHQNGMNGAQAILRSFMDYQVISNMPDLVEMTGAWKGGVGGDTCSAFAAATLIIGFQEENRTENLQKLKNWFNENYGSISCPSITAQAGGRPSKQQKEFCDMLSAHTAEYVYLLLHNKEK